MKTEAEIRAGIKDVKRRYAHVLEGDMATVEINAPRALLQFRVVAELDIL